MLGRDFPYEIYSQLFFEGGRAAEEAGLQTLDLTLFF